MGSCCRNQTLAVCEGLPEAPPDYIFTGRTIPPELPEGFSAACAPLLRVKLELESCQSGPAGITGQGLESRFHLQQEPQLRRITEFGKSL